MAAEAHRLFFALWPDEGTRAALGRAASALRSRQPQARGRWVGVERYHVTLHFLGTYPGAFPEALARSVADVAADLPPTPAFDLRIDVTGSFPGRAAPWWLGTSRLPAPLRELWQRLGEALRDAGLPHDERRDFTPHVTVLRDPARSLPSTDLGDASLDWPVESFALVHSGARGYTVLDRWSLHAEAS